MSEYLIYGKFNKECTWNGIHHYPDKTFKALNYAGVRVSRLADADSYATREDAQEVIDRVKANYEKKGLEKDTILLEIRKAK